ncbi:MAG: YeeE/YedE thiosulfate transporter family protein [Polyangia bacterium]
MRFLGALQSGLLLAGVALGHALLTGRMLAVSGRVTRLVERLRQARPPVEEELSPAELLQALQDATSAQFGEPAPRTPPPSPPSLPLPPPRPAGVLPDLLFFACVALGGTLSRLQQGDLRPSLRLDGLRFAELTATPGRAVLLLFLGGVLVGLGARMAGGCTSGHGLCGASRLQPGSLVSTASFLAGGIAVALLLEALR